MKFINQVLSYIDESSPRTKDNNSTNYKDFQETMSSIFKAVEDLSYMEPKYAATLDPNRL